MYLIKYHGPFGFIKPWTAVRDSEVFTQQFLTPSIIAGLERKLFPELLFLPYSLYKIKRHRLFYKQISHQQEQTQPRGWNKKRQSYERPYSIITRGIMIEPVLFLGFDSMEDALIVSKQHICLCRNEDILYPNASIIELSEENFDDAELGIHGFELIFEENEQSFLVGYNRYDENKPMFGWLKIIGNPVKDIC